MPGPQHNTAARVAPSEECLTFEQALNFVVRRSEARMREASPPLSDWDLTPEARKAIGYLWRAFETGDVRTLKIVDIYGTERLCAVPPSQWRVDPTQLVVEGFEAMNGNFEPLIARIESYTAGVLIPVRDLLMVFSAKRSERRPAARPRRLPLDEVAAALLRLYPKGRGPRDTYDALLARLEEDGVVTSLATLKRAIKKAGPSWR